MVNELTLGMKMDLQNEEKKQDNQDQSYLWIIYAFLIFLFVGVVTFLYRRFFEKPILKSELAKKYDVSVKVLMNWVTLLCPGKIQAKYLGKKIKMVLPSDFYSYFGKPDARPVDRKGRKIITRKGICRHFNISQITLNRRLKELESLEEAIGMSFPLFTKLRQLPPRQTQLIIEVLMSKGYAHR